MILSIYQNQPKEIFYLCKNPIKVPCVFNILPAQIRIYLHKHTFYLCDGHLGVRATICLTNILSSSPALYRHWISDHLQWTSYGARPSFNTILGLYLTSLKKPCHLPWSILGEVNGTCTREQAQDQGQLHGDDKRKVKGFRRDTCSKQLLWALNRKVRREKLSCLQQDRN